jgi:hypothetical protein
MLSGMNGSSTALVASAVSAVVALLVVALQASMERRRVRRAERVERLAAFFADVHGVAIAIGGLAQAPAEDKAEAEAVFRNKHADRLNFRLWQIRLLEDHDVVTAAVSIDRELVRQVELARARQWGREEWRNERSELAGMIVSLEILARSLLKSRGRGSSDSDYIVRGN